MIWRDAIERIGIQRQVKSEGMKTRTAREETLGATHQDVLDAPSHKVAEVTAGTLHTHPRPAMRHAWSSSRLGGRLDGPFNPGAGGPGGWWIIDEPELHLSAGIVVPDLAGWWRETMPEYPDAACFTIAPDWVSEVPSPSMRLDLGEKRDLWAREDVRHLWLVDPDARTLEAFAWREGHRLLLATLVDDAPVSLPPLGAATSSSTPSGPR